MLESIATIRSFNRTVTQAIGVLHDHYLGMNRPLAECRLIFEIGKSGAEVSELRSRLDLDSGYLSRLLRSLELQGLVATETSLHDKRARRVRLTSAGAAELCEQNKRSDELAQFILDKLSDRQRVQLTEAMAEVERLLSALAVRVEVERPTSADAQYCLSHYYEELRQRFDSGFDPALSASPSLDEFQPPRGAFLVMRLHGEPVGCGGFKAMGDAAYIKRMWIAGSARGLGLGKQLLHELEHRAEAMGFSRLVLETHRTLVEAQQLYRSAGYREVQPFSDELYAHHWFEKSISGKP